MRRLAALLCLAPGLCTPGLPLACAQSAPGQTSLATNAPAGAPLSTRVVAYEIDARVDAIRKTVDATETLTYRNLTGEALTSFPFHLYLNAFQPRSTFTTETHFGGGIRDSESGDDYPARKLGSITIEQLSVDGLGDQTHALRFTAPDDGNAEDHTVAVLDLPRPLAPGESITFRMRFHDRFPESVARNGYRRDFLMGGQWFPKVGVFSHGAWNCHQYHSTSEFFSDFGTYAVRLRLPRDYSVGATGVPTGEHDNDDGSRTHSFYGEDIHDFAWAASPHFTLTTGTYLSALGPVQVRVLALAAHPGAGQRYLNILLGSLAQFEQRYGVYPYKILTLVDPEPDSEIGGMEYPTLITGEASLLDPTLTQEVTSEHEFGHQYWYGMVATNEFEDAWLDEGINSYSEVNVMAALFGRRTSLFSRPWASASDQKLQYDEYAAIPNYDPVTRASWLFRNASSYAAVTYGKSATLLKTLEGLIGKDTMDEAMRTYFQRFRFTHPTTEDFLHTIEEVAIAHGRATTIAHLEAPAGPGLPAVEVASSSLRPYFNQAVYGTDELDYAIDSVRSGPAEWWQSTGHVHVYRDSVTVHRLGSFVLPETLQVIFADGYRLRETWNPGQIETAGENTRWKTYTYISAHGRIVSAELDPDHLLQLDLNRFNDSRSEPKLSGPARKLTTLWVSGMQFVSQCAGWLI